jgi:hypothetical protein
LEEKDWVLLQFARLPFLCSLAPAAAAARPQICERFTNGADEATDDDNLQCTSVGNVLTK